MKTPNQISVLETDHQEMKRIHQKIKEIDNYIKILLLSRREKKT